MITSNIHAKEWKIKHLAFYNKLIHGLLLLLSLGK
jgi:hypothetical protein